MPVTALVVMAALLQLPVRLRLCITHHPQPIDAKSFVSGMIPPSLLLVPVVTGASGDKKTAEGGGGSSGEKKRTQDFDDGSGNARHRCHTFQCPVPLDFIARALQILLAIRRHLASVEATRKRTTR